MPDDTGGISDEATISLNDVGDLGALLGAPTKGPVDVYVQTLPDGGKRVVNRYGEVLSDDHVLPDDGIVQMEPYPGASGGPPLPVPEGDPQ